MTYTKNQIEFLSTLRKMFPGQTQFTRKELLLAKTALGYSVIPVWITGDPQRKWIKVFRPKISSCPATLAEPIWHWRWHSKYNMKISPKSVV